jgi:hypothetical protein
MKCIHCIKDGILFEGEYYCRLHLDELLRRLYVEEKDKKRILIGLRLSNEEENQ